MDKQLIKQIAREVGMTIRPHSDFCPKVEQLAAFLARAIEAEARAEAQEPVADAGTSVVMQKALALAKQQLNNYKTASPQSPAPCPTCAESVAVVERYVAHGANCCAINRTPSYRMLPHGTRLFTEDQLIQSVEAFKAELRENGTIVESALQAKVAELEQAIMKYQASATPSERLVLRLRSEGTEQRAEIERLTKELNQPVIQSEWQKQQDAIAQQAERIAELDEANEHHRELAQLSRDAELNAVRIAATQAALIEQCEKALLWCPDFSHVREALSAVAAYKKE